MPKQAPALTDAKVKNLRPAKDQQGAREIADGGQRGLILRLSPRGERSWAVRTMVNGRRVFHGLGSYPAVSLSEARRRAHEVVSAARDGLTPDALEAQCRAETLTVTEAKRDYMEAQRRRLRRSTLATKEGLWRDHISPVLGNRLLRQIRRADVLEVRDKVEARGFATQANRVASEVMAFLRWAEDRQFVAAVPTVRRMKAREQPRERILGEPELVALWHACGEPGTLTADFIRLLLLTGQRRDEVRLMVWNEVDLDTALWRIPAQRYKTNRMHEVPLPPAAVAILRARWQEGAAGFVLPGRSPGTAFNGAAAGLKRTRRRMGPGADFRLHDVRRTVRTGLSRLGVDEATAERVIGHVPQGLLKVYDHHDRLAEKRDALERWAEYLLALVGDRGANVVPLRRAE